MSERRRITIDHGICSFLLVGFKLHQTRAKLGLGGGDVWAAATFNKRLYQSLTTRGNNRLESQLDEVG